MRRTRAEDDPPTGRRAQHPPAVAGEGGSIDDRLRFAIASKRLIELSYAGTRRVAEPHDYGARKGTPMLLVYQRRGSSSSQPGGVKGWRLLTVSKIERCVVLEEEFVGSRGESHSHHHTWDVVYARVT